MDRNGVSAEMQNFLEARTRRGLLRATRHACAAARSNAHRRARCAAPPRCAPTLAQPRCVPCTHVLQKPPRLPRLRNRLAARCASGTRATNPTRVRVR
jgi:hypothetical protein